MSMRATTLFLIPILLSSCAAASRSEGRWKMSPHQDADGFSLSIPQDWKVQKSGAGRIEVIGPNPLEFVLVVPVLGRTADCSGTLRAAFEKGWKGFPGIQHLKVNGVGRGISVADFQFQNGDGH